MARGANAIFGEDHIAAICEGLASGTPLSVILRTPGMPSKSSVMQWQRNNPEIGERIQTARDLGFDEIAYRLREVARGKEGSSGDVMRDKLIVWTDLQLLAKWDGKRYGEKIEHSGTIATQPADMDGMLEMLVTQVTMNPTLRPVLTAWAQKLIERIQESPT
jgi:hypothetical protein